MPQLVPFYHLGSDLLDLQGMPHSPIYLCVLVLAIILLCTEQGSSTNQDQAHKQDQTVEIPRPSQANPAFVNLTYVDFRAPISGIIKKVIVDLNDAQGAKLKDLWPLNSYKRKNVMVGNTMRWGLELPDRTLQDYRTSGTRYPEVQQHGHTGIWVSAIMNPNLFNLRVVTQGSQVETQPIAAYSLTTIGTGTGQTLKSFIRK